MPVVYGPHNEEAMENILVILLSAVELFLDLMRH